MTVPELARLVARKENATAALLRGDVPHARDTLVHTVARLEALLAHEDPTVVVTELANCEYNLGLLEATAGSFSRARDHLERATSLYVLDSDKDRCRLQSALLLMRSGGEAEEAERLGMDVLDRWVVEAPDDRALIASAQAGLAETRGDWVAALDTLENARTMEGIDGAVSAGLAARAGSVLLRLGRLDEAAQLLKKAWSLLDSRGHRLDAMLVAIELALVALARGLDEEASASLSELLRNAESSRHDNPRSLGEGSPIRARCLDLLGTIDRGRGGLGELAQASSRHAQAAALFDAGGWVRQAAVSRMNQGLDHLETQRARSIARAESLLREALHVLGDDRPTPELADGHVAHGIALALLSQPGGRQEASAAFRTASKIYAAAGLTVERTTALHNLGWITAEDADAGGLSDEDRSALRQSALELLIPAALVRDSARYDVALQYHRRAWWNTHAAASWGAALRVAIDAGDNRLVPELIARARRSGIVDLADTERAETVETFGEWARSASDRGSRVVTTPTALRLVPGPQLRMPGDSRIALRKYVTLASTEYGLDNAHFHSIVTAGLL